MKLQPMNVGEILDQTFKIYGGQFRSYLAISGLGMAAVFVIFLLSDLLIPLGSFSFVRIFVTLVTLLITLVMSGAIVKKASLHIMDQPLSIADAYRFSFRRMGRLLVGAVLRWLAVLIGGILLLIPGIYAFVSFSLFEQAVIIEDRGAWRALGRSRKLVRGTWWRVFGILLLFTLLATILTCIIEGPIYFLLMRHLFTAAIGAHRPITLSIGAKIALQIGSPVVNLFTAPFFAIAYTLLYYDLRTRKEDLDLEAMIDNLTGTDGPVDGLQA